MDWEADLQRAEEEFELLRRDELNRTAVEKLRANGIESDTLKDFDLAAMEDKAVPMDGTWANEFAQPGTRFVGRVDASTLQDVSGPDGEDPTMWDPDGDGIAQVRLGMREFEMPDIDIDLEGMASAAAKSAGWNIMKQAVETRQLISSFGRDGTVERWGGAAGRGVYNVGEKYWSFFADVYDFLRGTEDDLAAEPVDWSDPRDWARGIWQNSPGYLALRETRKALQEYGPEEAYRAPEGKEDMFVPTPWGETQMGKSDQLDEMIIEAGVEYGMMYKLAGALFRSFTIANPGMHQFAGQQAQAALPAGAAQRWEAIRSGQTLTNTFMGVSRQGTGAVMMADIFAEDPRNGVLFDLVFANEGLAGWAYRGAGLSPEQTAKGLQEQGRGLEARMMQALVAPVLAYSVGAGTVGLKNSGKWLVRQGAEDVMAGGRHLLDNARALWMRADDIQRMALQGLRTVRVPGGGATATGPGLAPEALFYLDGWIAGAQMKGRGQLTAQLQQQMLATGATREQMVRSWNKVGAMTQLARQNTAMRMMQEVERVGAGKVSNEVMMFLDQAVDSLVNRGRSKAIGEAKDMVEQQ